MPNEMMKVKLFYGRDEKLCLSYPALKGSVTKTRHGLQNIKQAKALCDELDIPWSSVQIAEGVVPKTEHKKREKKTKKQKKKKPSSKKT